MKITGGQLLLFAASLLVSVGFAVPSQYHQSTELRDIVILILIWCFFLISLKYHDRIFRRERILVVVMPTLFIGFACLLLSLNYLLSFGIREFNLYAILLGWFLFNLGLYYDTRKVLKDKSAKG
jgi:presenilin-like A22 family membrane protease